MKRPAIAVTGMAFRLSGASNAESFWANVSNGRDPFVPLPPIRFDPVIFERELPVARRVVFGALVDDFGLDWRALRMPPAQIEHLHHVERLSLAVMGGALTDAGLRPGSEPLDRAGIWMAASSFGPDPWLDPMPRIRRFELAHPLHEELDALVPDRAAEIGAVIDRVTDLAAPPLEPDVLMVSACIAAGRASQIYDLRGGHLAIDAGMCSSLAALQQAVRALQSGDIDAALVCASAPLITPSSILAFAHRGELGSERPRPFQANTSGTLLGDGAVAVVLERHEEVTGKRVYAIVEGMGSCVVPGQADAEALTRSVGNAARQALGEAELDAERVRLIESRAAGIAALDRAEAEGLASIYCRGRSAGPLSLTSGVPTMGFLQAASGLAAFAKASLAIHHRCWPAQAATQAAFEPIAGLRVPCAVEHWTEPIRVAVSDAGPVAAAYHAILADPRESAPRRRTATRPSKPEPIAIVGAGVIAPGAPSLETFWQSALTGDAQLADLPKSRWDSEKLIGSSPELARAFRTRLGCTVDLPSIDTSRYRTPPADDANPIDPAALLALSVTDQALQDANYSNASCPAHRVKVIFGQVALRANEIAAEKRVQYALLAALALEAMREAGLAETDAQAVAAGAQARFDRDNRKFSRTTLHDFSSLASADRAAAAFGLSGGVLSVDAACASSLAALRIAANALRDGEADAVIAGGVSYHLFPEYYIGLGLLDALSTRGGRPFHKDADGFIPAEAAGAVVLKRLSDAQRAGDRIYAVITGHGVSSDGHGLTIYSANPAGQKLAIARALAGAELRPESIDLIEAHGPGAPLGDRAEMTSIAATYSGRPHLPPLTIASAKSLVGHSSSAGAMLSLIRAALALASKVLPPSGGNGETAADLPFGAELALSRVARPWINIPGRPRRAAVNSFGMTGVDHHVVLEEVAVEPNRDDVPRVALEHPVAPPARPLSAGRFIIVESAVSLPPRDASYPLQGRKLVVVAPTPSPLLIELERALSARGAVLIRLLLREQPTEADVLAGLPCGASEIDGVLDLSALNSDTHSADLTQTVLWPELKNHSDRSFAILKALYERFSTPASARGCYVAVTSVASGSEPVGNPLGAFYQGLARVLKQEVPSLLCKAIDVDPRVPSPQIAEFISREIEDGNDRVDVHYSDRRYVTTLQRADFANETPLRHPLQPGDVFVFSGGGRGVVYQCATALAQRGLHVVVTGRRPLPDESLAWVRMSDAEFSDFRRTELARRRGTEGPAQIIRALDDLDLQRQAYANIASAQTAGLSLHYETCDINDQTSVTAVLARVRSRFGRIDGVGHGAMIEHSAIVPRKAGAAIDSTLRTKVIGLLNLVQATRQDRLKWFVAYGSGVGRYGNSGQTDYAAANALVATLLSTYAKTTLRQTHCVTIDWPAWESLGATANRDIAELLRKAGVTAISPEEGVYWFLSELALGEAPEVVICGDRMLQEWPFLAREADGKGERAIEVDDQGRPLISSRWPMLDRLVQNAPATQVVEHRISVQRDLYMSQHLLNGLPVLPATFGCELLAEGAALCYPGLHVRQILDFHVAAPLGLPRRDPVTARVVVRPAATEGSRRVTSTELRSPLAAKLKLGEDRLHHAARIALSELPPSSLGTYEFPKRSEVVHATSIYALAKDPVHLGQLFSIARWIQVFHTEATGSIEPASISEMFAEHSAPRLLACPLLLDAALQVAGSWDGYCNGYVSVPMGIGSVTLGRLVVAGEVTRAHARVLRIEDPNVYYDISIVGDNSELVVSLNDVHLRRVGILKPRE